MQETAQLARFALELQSRDVPESTRAVARAAVLDTLACGIAGRDERVTRSLRDWARSRARPATLDARVVDLFESA